MHKILQRVGLWDENESGAEVQSPVAEFWVLSQMGCQGSVLHRVAFFKALLLR